MSAKVNYGWFSAKSVIHVATMNEIANTHHPLAFWYRKEVGGMVLVTEVTSTEKYTSNFDDFEFVGNVEDWLRTATDEEAIAEAEKKKNDRLRE